MTTISTVELSPDDVVTRGKAIYEQSIRAEVEDGNIGRLLMIDVLTGHWVLGDDRIQMARHLRAQNSDAMNFALRVGYPATLGTETCPRKEICMVSGEFTAQGQAEVVLTLKRGSGEEAEVAAVIDTGFMGRCFCRARWLTACNCRKSTRKNCV